MAQILLELDDSMLRALERVAPVKSRQRTRFIRLAIQKALMEREDLATRAAYAMQPDAPAPLDAQAWGEWKPERRAAVRRSPRRAQPARDRKRQRR